MNVSTRVIDKTNISVVTTRLINILLAMPMFERLELLEYLEEKLRHKNRRKYPRGDYLTGVEIYTDNISAVGTIKNLGPDGLLIATKTLFHIGDEVVVTFRLPNSEDLIQISAKIVRKSSEGVGIKFKMPILDFLI